MCPIYRHLSKVFLALLIASMILPSNQAAAAVCQNLPPSKLLVYDIQTSRLEEETVPAAKLDQQMPPGALTSGRGRLEVARCSSGRARRSRRGRSRAGA